MSSVNSGFLPKLRCGEGTMDAPVDGGRQAIVDSCHAASTKRVGTQHHQVHELPLGPPSPYKPTVAKRVYASVLPSLFSRKMEDPVRYAKHPVPNNHGELIAGITAHHSPTGRLRDLGDMTPASVSSLRYCATVCATNDGEYGGVSDMMLRCQKNDVQRVQVASSEAYQRRLHLSEADLAFSKITIQFLHGLQEFYAHTCGAVMDVERSKRERAEQRHRMLDTIEKDTTQRLAKERVLMAIASQVKQLADDHCIGRESIVQMEQDALNDIVKWNKKNRPLGPGLFILAPVDDPRLKYMKQQTSLSTRSVLPLSKTEVYQRKLREGRGPRGSLLGTAGGNFMLSSMDEGWFAIEGRQAYQHEKQLKYEALRRSSAMSRIVEEEQISREEHLLEESTAWMPLLLYGVDGLYAARNMTRLRMAKSSQLESGADDDTDIKTEIRSRMANDKLPSSQSSMQKLLPGVVEDAHADDASLPCEDAIMAVESANTESYAGYSDCTPMCTSLNAIMEAELRRNPHARSDNPLLTALVEVGSQTHQHS